MSTRYLLQSLRPHRVPRHLSPHYQHLPARRASSSAAASTPPPLSSDLSTTLTKTLTTRKLPPLAEYISPHPSYVLEQSLSAFLPKSWGIGSSIDTVTDTTATTTSSSSTNASPHHPFKLKPGYHIIHFNPVIPDATILPDGTDPLHSPSAPFVRRMWAGGSVHFLDQDSSAETGKGRDEQETSDIGEWVGRERIRSVNVKGLEGGEKVFVGIERFFGRRGEGVGEGVLGMDTDGLGEGGDKGEEVEARLRPWRIVERRNLVFMRKSEGVKAGEVKRRAVVSRHKPDFKHTLTPTPTLLFRFSALTFNAHSIHLDKHYCQTEEGHRDLLFHGPMSLVLLLTMLRREPSLRPASSSSHLSSSGDTQIRTISYQNVAPLYANEPLTLCAAKGKGEGQVFVWIEGPDGGVAVKGEAKLVV